jgi:hypothetical protein
MKSAPPPQFDRQFIEEHQLVERYLESKLPYKGQRDLENWCQAHPEYLTELHLSERTHASLKLLEASGRPPDLGEPPTPWWKTPHALIVAGVLTLASLAVCSFLVGKVVLMRGALEDARMQLKEGALAAPATQRNLRVSPDRAAGINGAKVVVSRAMPELLHLHIDMSYSSEKRFRVTIDKRGQARALVIGALAKDSNGDLGVAFNSAALSPGFYDVRIEALPLLGAPIDAGWLTLDAR